MSNIINKSNHPVEVKRIDIRVWKLRDEIEAAIAKEIQANPNPDQKVNIEHIQEFYTKFLNSDLQANSDDEDSDNEEENQNLDSSGNPLDDDAMAMMAALGGGEPEEEADETEEAAEEDAQPEVNAEANPEEEDSSEIDDEAAAMAAQMLADQGLSPAESDGNDDSDANAEKDIAQKEFERVIPSQEKISKGFCLLSDIQMDQIMVFSKDTFIVGQNIIIEFMIPNSFSQLVQVVGTSNISRSSSIISDRKPDYRLQCIFLFKFPNERSTLRNFLKSVEPEIPEPPKKLKRPDNEDEDDDFDDLGF